MLDHDMQQNVFVLWRLKGVGSLAGADPYSAIDKCLEFVVIHIRLAGKPVSYGTTPSLRQGAKPPNKAKLALAG